MGLNRSPITVILVVFTVFTVILASDMSIISYDETHADKSSWRTEEEVMSLYEEWRVRHGKVSNNNLGEKDKRFGIFKDNLRFIDEHNAENRTYKVGLNRFADLSNQEYKSIYLGIRTDSNRLEKAVTKSNRYAASVVHIYYMTTHLPINIRRIPWSITHYLLLSPPHCYQSFDKWEIKLYIKFIEVVSYSNLLSLVQLVKIA
ncbi:hypothetical protein RYX36_013715, partial [Vicia faba]